MSNFGQTVLNKAFSSTDTHESPHSVTIQPRWQTGTSMKALVWHGKNDVRVENHEIPDVTEPEDALVKVTCATVCGSDLHLYQGEAFELKEGDILGHECAGVVEKVGNGVTNVKVGDRVVVTAVIACGECKWCKQGLTSACSETNDSSAMEKLYGTTFSGIFGYGHITGGYPGSQAEFVRVPFANINCVKLPDDVPFEKGLYLSDIVVTSHHAVVSADIQEGETVGVWGLGPVGALTVQWAKIMGASKIVAIDNVAHRLELVKQKYGAETINFAETPDVVMAIKKLVGPDGLDKGIDASGFRYTKTVMQSLQRAIGASTDSSDVVNEIILSVRKFGKIALIADFLGYTNNFNLGGMMEKGITLVGCSQNPGHKYGETCLKHIQDGTFDPLDVVSHRFKLEQIADVYKRFNEKAGGIEKVFLETVYAPPRAAGPILQADVWKDV